MSRNEQKIPETNRILRYTMEDIRIDEQVEQTKTTAEPKRQLMQAQLDQLAKAREKANAVRKIVAQNNLCRDSSLGWIDDCFYQKSTLRKYNTHRNEQWKGALYTKYDDLYTKNDDFVLTK